MLGLIDSVFTRNELANIFPLACVVVVTVWVIDFVLKDMQNVCPAMKDFNLLAVKYKS